MILPAIPTSTATINLSLTPCQVGASNEPGVLLALCLGQQPKLSARLTEGEWEAVKRAGDAAIARSKAEKRKWYQEADSQ